MKQRLTFFGRYAIFWIGYFLIARLLFLLYEYSYSFDLPVSEWFLSMFHGLRMDLSTTGYIMALVGIILIFTSFSNGRQINRIIQPLTITILSIMSVIIIGDLELYSNWGYRMDASPLLYLANPQEALASTKLWLEIALLLLTIIYILLGIFIYKKAIKKHILAIEKATIVTPFYLLFLTGCMILPVRGSLGIAPLNTGMVYFSEHKFANHAAVNVVWNVMNSLVYRKSRDRTYDYMQSETAQKIAQQLYDKKGENIAVLNKKKPNVVIIILESFSSKILPIVGGKWEAAPNLNRLAKEGILFRNFYANGSRSDKGIVSIISGFPAQPTSSIIKTPSKTESLPSLYKSFKTEGYTSYFYYGGDINFANMHSYFLNAEVDRIISLDDFDSKLNNSKWGVHDEHIFDLLKKDLINDKEPYLKTVFTLSSHDPFDVPMDPVFKGNDRGTQYLNSVYYTDSCLGRFFNEIRKTPVWNNTLFVLLADHGSSRPGNTQNHEIEKFKIPMIWLGGVLNDSIKCNDKIGSQIDLPATLLGQLGINYDDYTYSKNLFTEGNNEFAFYAFNDGFGLITDTSFVIYDNVANRPVYSEGDYKQDLNKGKAYLQSLMLDCLSR